MKHRKLRIAWSVAWGIAAVLLCALWVRSYWWADNLLLPITDRHAVAIGSMLGGVSFSPWLPTAYRIPSSRMFRSEKYGEPPPEFINGHLPPETLARIAEFAGSWAHAKNHPPPIRFGSLNHFFLSPYFVLVGGATILAALSWVRWRFSLGTLLIATTLVAVVLGTVARLSR
jgi:hypothetical protein